MNGDQEDDARDLQEALRMSLEEGPTTPPIDWAALIAQAQAAQATTTTTTTMVGDPKMVIVVNTALHMGVGKAAAQACHACLAVYRTAQRGGGGLRDVLAVWEACGETTVVLRANDAAELHALHDTATRAAMGVAVMAAVLICDAGRTQVAPGSPTALALFGPRDAVDRITGHLKLL
jgi:PTH2 family peptidyl-tRNA hydrolase